jgi:hypothetical protein
MPNTENPFFSNQKVFVPAAARGLLNNAKLVFEVQKFVRTPVYGITAYILVPSICILVVAFSVI